MIHAFTVTHQTFISQMQGCNLTNIFWCIIHCLLFCWAIKIQVYHFNSCITSSFTSRNLKQKLTRETMLNLETLTETQDYSQNVSDKVVQSAKCFLLDSWSVSYSHISNWGQTRASIKLKLCSFISLFWQRKFPFMNVNPHRDRDWL